MSNIYDILIQLLLVFNVEEWKLTREIVKNEIYEKDRTEIDNLKEKLKNTRTSEDRANIYWQLKEKYKLLYWGYAEEFAIFANTPKEEYYKQLVKGYRQSRKMSRIH